jgi:hypothetical protein
MSAPYQTDLTIGNVVIPYGAARGVSVQISGIDAGRPRRTVNGTLIDLTRTTHKKIRVQISCTDQAAPTLAGRWSGGDVLTVGLPKPIRQALVAGGATLIRTPVPGSVRCLSADGTVVPHTLTGLVVSGANGAAFVEYRPSLQMMVIEAGEEGDEWAASEGWSITLEEV